MVPWLDVYAVFTLSRCGRTEPLRAIGVVRSMDYTRRDFLTLMTLGGVVFSSGLAGCGTTAVTGSARAAPRAGNSAPSPASVEDFFFLQLSDTHWGFEGPPNPEAAVTLKHAVATINAVDAAPDFITFTGDLTQTTDDGAVRRKRMSEFKEIVSALKVKTVRFIPGEHDAAPDHGDAFHEAFGESHYSFDHKGVHFVALDNVSETGGALGKPQLDWLQADLVGVAQATPIVVFAHRPLFDLYPDWDWTTRDGGDALAILSQRQNVTVFYGHIHQEHHQQTGAIRHHAARSLVFPLPAPGSVPKKAPLPWDATSADHGLGYRQIELSAGGAALHEIGLRST